MCGIAGVVVFDPQAPSPVDPVRAMSDVCASRGPDGDGLWALGPVALGHRRLAILDLSERALQPMLDADERVAITYNGEIYNFHALRAELESHGARFRSDSDTEVILQGYLHWGIPRLLERLDGMFAFALYDIRERRTYLCRDRFGKKPLYYGHAPGRLAFCSDVRGLWLVSDSLSIDPDALDYYLTELSVPQPWSIWREVRQVKPASFIVVDADGHLSEHVYWTRHCEPTLELTEDEILAQLEQRIREAVLKRTVSDVPIAAFLSAGVDSGLVVALLAASWGARLRTFSVSVPDPEMDEGPLARRLAERWGTDHTQLNLTAASADVLPAIVESFGEPFADSSAVPTYLIARAIGRHVKVVLSGDGGDDLFGYPEYVWAHRADEHLARHPGRVSRVTARVLDKARRLAGGDGEFVGYIQHFASLSGADRLYRTMGFSFADKQRLYAPDARGASADFARRHLEAVWADSERGGLADTLIEGGLRTRLLNDYLIKIDRASMAHSLEVRSPFLDTTLTEFALRLPNALRFKQGTAKYLLKKLGERYIDPDIFQRPKRGFSIPLGTWLRSDCRDLAHDVLASKAFRTRGLFDMAFVDRLHAAHLAGREDHEHRLWALLCLELWFRRFVDTPPPRSASTPALTVERSAS